MSKANLSQEFVCSILDYDPCTGIFRWRHRTDVPKWWNTKYSGKEAGSLEDDGYIRILINCQPHRAHRLAWLISTGEWPNGQIDHISGNRADNRIENLRSVTNSLNMQNQKKAYPTKNSTSQFLGVSWFKQQSRWRADIRVNRKLIYLGLFDREEDAANAYLVAKKRLHPGFVAERFL